MEIVFGEEVVEVVAGDSAGDLRKLFADFVCVLVGDLPEGGLDLIDAIVAAARYFRAAGQPMAAVPTGLVGR